MRAELEKEIAKWKKAFLDESNELAKRSTELNDLHDAYAILAEKYEAAIASQAQREPLKVSENWREPLSADAMQRLKNLGVLDKSLPPAPEGDTNHG